MARGSAWESEILAMATELLASRDALAALTKEAVNVLAIIDRARERGAVDANYVILSHERAFERARAALAATEEKQP
jgi:HPt (histidine-containing phosphotransfer) domain-containing protein